MSPQFFSTPGEPMLLGRSIGAVDARAPVAVVSARLWNRQYGANPDVVSRQADSAIAGHVHSQSIGRVARAIGVSYAIAESLLLASAGGLRGWRHLQAVRTAAASFAYLIVQASEEATSMAGVIRRSVAEIDRHIAFDHIRTLEETRSRSAAEPRFRTVLLVSLAVLSSILAVIGLYGAVAYSVSMRTTELGIRMDWAPPPRTSPECWSVKG